MSKEAEESLDSKQENAQDVSDTVSANEATENEPCAETVDVEKNGSVDEQSASDEVSPQEPVPDTTYDKYLAIRSILRQQEDEQQQQEETRQQIADKVKRFKYAKENPVQDDPPETAPKAEHPKKKKRSKKRKSVGSRIRSLFPQRGDGVLEVIRKFVFLGSSAVFIVCLGLISNYFWENYQNAKVNEGLRDIYTASNSTTGDDSDVIDDYEYYGYLSGAENLLEINSDVVGWLSIPDTEIDYPVLQYKYDENEYYLTRNIYRESVKAGSIFLDYRNLFDVVENGRKLYENSTNLIIYGHNMHDYSMFGSLKYYINNASYYDEHPIIELNSNYRKYQYKIFAMIIVDVNDTTDTEFDYWNHLNFADETEFYDYVNEIKRRTVRLTDVDVTYGDQLLTLSTCNSTFSEGRLVVFARLLRDGEDLYEGTVSTANPNIKWPNSYYKWHENTYDPDAEFEPYG
jgi:sortase B